MNVRFTVENNEEKDCMISYSHMFIHMQTIAAGAHIQTGSQRSAVNA